MEKIREIVAYKHYFEEFLSEQTEKVQNKIFKVLEGGSNFGKNSHELFEAG